MLSFKEFINLFYIYEAKAESFRKIQGFNPDPNGTPEQQHHQDLLDAWNRMDSLRNKENSVSSVDEMREKVEPVLKATKRDNESKRFDRVYRSEMERSGRYVKLHEGVGIDGNPFTIWQIKHGESGQGTSTKPFEGNKWCTSDPNLVKAGNNHMKYDPTGAHSLVFHFPKEKGNLQLISSIGVRSNVAPITSEGGNFQDKGNNSMFGPRNDSGAWQRLVDNYRLNDLGHLLGGLPNIKYDPQKIVDHYDPKATSGPRSIPNEARLIDVSGDQTGATATQRKKANEQLLEISKNRVRRGVSSLIDLARLGKENVDMRPGTEMGTYLMDTLHERLSNGFIGSQFLSAVKNLGHDINVDKSVLSENLSKRIIGKRHSLEEVKDASDRGYLTRPILDLLEDDLYQKAKNFEHSTQEIKQAKEYGYYDKASNILEGFYRQNVAENGDKQHIVDLIKSGKHDVSDIIDVMESGHYGPQTKKAHEEFLLQKAKNGELSKKYAYFLQSRVMGKSQIFSKRDKRMTPAINQTDLDNIIGMNYSRLLEPDRKIADYMGPLAYFWDKEKRQSSFPTRFPGVAAKALKAFKTRLEGNHYVDESGRVNVEALRDEGRYYGRYLGYGNEIDNAVREGEKVNASLGLSKNKVQQVIDEPTSSGAKYAGSDRDRDREANNLINAIKTKNFYDSDLETAHSKGYMTNPVLFALSDHYSDLLRRTVANKDTLHNVTKIVTNASRYDILDKIRSEVHNYLQKYYKEKKNKTNAKLENLVNLVGYVHGD